MRKKKIMAGGWVGRIGGGMGSAEGEGVFVF
jgi:hypothetical protein